MKPPGSKGHPTGRPMESDTAHDYPHSDHSRIAFLHFLWRFHHRQVLLKSADQLTVMVGLFLFRSDRFDVDFGKITAGAVLAMLPVIMLYFPLQKYVISGMTMGAVKE